MEGGGLVAERFSAAGGEDDEGVAAVEHGLHGGMLEWAEGVVAPCFLDEGEEGGEVLGGEVLILCGHGGSDLGGISVAEFWGEALVESSCIFCLGGTV